MNPRKLTVILILIFLVIFVVAAVGMIKVKSVAGVKVVGKSLLVVDLSKSYPELVPYEFDMFTLRRKVPFYRLLSAIYHAAEDDNIEGILLKGHCSLGFSRTWELAQALRNFKKAGKKVYGYFDYGGLSNMFLAGLCDKVGTPPQGEFYFPGIMANLLFLKETFAKIGIGFDVIQMGKYKGAGEMFANDSMSVWLRESYNKLLDDLYAQIQRDWKQDLGLSLDSLTLLTDSLAILTAKEAKAFGIVDTIEYWNDFKRDLVGNHENRLLSLSKYILSNPEWKHSSDKKIALVVASGNIIYGRSRWGTEAITADRYAKIFRKLADASDISAIVFRVDSPGGSALTSDIIYHEVARAAEKKPVIVSMSSVAASGGYYISMAADTIFATPYTITGSIGVIMLRPHFGELYKKIGAHPQKLKRGRFADIVYGDHPLTDAERAVFERSLKEIYHQFVANAASGRDTSYEWIDSVAQGRVWSATAADSLALVDTLGSLWDAIRLAEKLAGVPDSAHARIVVKPRAKGLWDLMREMETSLVENIVPESVLEQFKLYFLAQEFSGRPLFLMPGKVEMN